MPSRYAPIVYRYRHHFLALLTAALVCGRLMWRDGLLGTPGGEVYGHAWVQWWHAEALPDWPSAPTQWLLESREWPVIDPLPTAIAALGTRLLGAEFGWNSLIFLGVLLAYVGGAALARRAGGSPVVGGLSLALAPSFLGSAASGLTEDLALGLSALALSRVGGRDWREGVIAGLLIGILSWCGLVLAWMTAVCAVMIGIVAYIRDRQCLKSLVLGASISIGMTVPAALLQGSRLAGEGHRSGVALHQFEPLWRLNPWRGIDVASLFWPGSVSLGDALIRLHPGYLGLIALMLALRSGRSKWWLVLLGAAACSLGTHFSWMGTPLGINNPFAQAMSLLPFGQLINHHGRILLLGAIALAALASIGAARLTPRLRLVATGLLLLDLTLLSPISPVLSVSPHAPLPIYDCETGACVDEFLPGAIVELPATGPGIHFQAPLLQQRFHRRPLLLNPNRPGLPPAYAQTASGRWLGALALPHPSAAPTEFHWPSGVSILVSRDKHTTARLASQLGPPTMTRQESAAWAREVSADTDPIPKSPPDMGD